MDQPVIPHAMVNAVKMEQNWRCTINLPELLCCY